MKRSSDQNRPNKQTAPESTIKQEELEGLVELGMSRPALAAAKSLLEQASLSVGEFQAAANAILTLASRIERWRPRVESAFQRLPIASRHQMRFWMMSIYSACADHRAILGLRPKRFEGPFALLELGYVLEAALELEDLGLQQELLPRLPAAMALAEHELTWPRLSLLQAECLMRSHRWSEALEVLGTVQTEELFSEQAVCASVEVHAAQAILALQAGRRLLKKFEEDFDPETGLILSGNEQSRHQHSERCYQRMLRSLGRVLPPARQKQLRLV